MKFIFYKVFVIFIVASNCLKAQNKLAYELTIGEQFKVHQIAKQVIQQDMSGQKHELNNLIESDFLFIVESANDSLYRLGFTFNRFKMVSSSNLIGEVISVNTDEDITEDNIEGKIFAQIVNVNLVMNMYKNGKIKSVEGSDKLISKMVDVLGNVDLLTKEVMRESMKKEFSNKSLASSFEQMTYIYPIHAVNIGDTWTNTFTGDLSSLNTWTLESITKDDINITGTSSVSFKTSDTDVDMILDGEMTSSIKTSTSTGFAKIMTTSSFVKGNSIMHTMNNLKVPTTITSNITYKIEKHVQ
jgi:hypothetical protein